jgi:chromate transporter
MSPLWNLVQTFVFISLVAIGGANAVLPEIHHQVVDVQSWMNNETFAGLFSLAQVAPGPNILIVSLIGWYVAGLPGLVIATVSVILPSCFLAFLVGRFLTRHSEKDWLRLLETALVPIAIGLMLAGGVVMARAADHAALPVAVTAAAAAFVLFSNRNPIWLLAAAGVIAAIARQLGGMA